jgi:hypothetical protein
MKEPHMGEGRKFNFILVCVTKTWTFKMKERNIIQIMEIAVKRQNEKKQGKSE